MSECPFESPLSHTNDPQTSYGAAEKMIKSGELSSQERFVLAGIHWYVKNRTNSFTAKDLRYWTGLDYFVIQRRLSGLRTKGKIERLNTEGGTYREGKGQKLMRRNGCAVWRLV